MGVFPASLWIWRSLWMYGLPPGPLIWAIQPLCVGLQHCCSLSLIPFITFKDIIFRCSQGPGSSQYGQFRTASLLFAYYMVLLASLSRELGQEKHYISKLALEHLGVPLEAAEELTWDKEVQGSLFKLVLPWQIMDNGWMDGRRQNRIVDFFFFLLKFHMRHLFKKKIYILPKCNLLEFSI